MNNITIIIGAFAWIVYGVLAYSKTNKDKFKQENKDAAFFAYIVFSPLILIYRMIYGAFQNYN